MTSGEGNKIDALTQSVSSLELRLFGLDGEHGAIGDLNAKIDPVVAFYQRATGVLLALGFVFAALGGLAALVKVAKALHDFGVF